MIVEARKPSPLARRLRAVLFVDVVDSVRLMQHDQDGTILRWREFMVGVSGDELQRHRGRLVKMQGDSMLIEFESAIDAVECALAMQARLARSESSFAPAQRIEVRMGIHLADVIADDIDLYGDGVNLAARLRDLGGPREIVISASVRDQLTDGLGVVIEDLGERSLKGMQRPVRAYRAWPPGPLPGRSTDRKRLAGDRPSIAALPFRNLSTDPAHDFLGDLIAEDVIGDLSRQSDLFVISRLSTTPFRDRLFEPRNVAEVLGVRYVLCGSVRASGKRLRIMAELTEAEIGRVIWADHFDGELGDIFEMQDKLSKSIAVRVVPYLRKLELERARSKHPDHLTAYERTLRAVDHLHRNSREDMDLARALLESAIASDPSYVAPYAWLAHWHVRRVGQGWSDDVALDTLHANRFAEEALRRDDTDPHALTVYGLVCAYLHKEPQQAIGYYDRALTINPSAASAWLWSTSAYSWLGNGGEAVARAFRAKELSPFDPLMYLFDSIAGTAHAVAGQYDEAVRLCRISLRQNRMFASTHRTLAIALALAGREEEARLAAAELLRLEPTLTVRGFLQRYPGHASPQAEVFAHALGLAGVPP